MESFLKRVCEGKNDSDAHRYFIRFGKGIYPRRFLIKMDVGKKIKVKTSFELANDLVKFVNELKNPNFSGKIISKNQINSLDGKKKAGSFVYEIENMKIDSLGEVYFYLLDAEDSDVKLKMKKALPKPGKDAEKIDDGFCVMELDLKYLQKVRDSFFWDAPQGKKIVVEHELRINEIVLPAGEKDPVKIRELARRKGTIMKKIIADGNENQKEYDVEV